MRQPTQTMQAVGCQSQRGVNAQCSERRQEEQGLQDQTADGIVRRLSTILMLQQQLGEM